MDRISLQVTNLNNSFVFYRNLLGTSFEKLEADCMRLTYKGLQLILTEGTYQKQQITNKLLVAHHEDLVEMLQRVKRYIPALPGARCKLLRNHLAITDPDGYRWVVSVNGTKTDNESEESCYNEPVLNTPPDVIMSSSHR